MEKEFSRNLSPPCHSVTLAVEHNSGSLEAKVESMIGVFSAPNCRVCMAIPDQD